MEKVVFTDPHFPQQFERHKCNKTIQDAFPFKSLKLFVSYLQNSIGIIPMFKKTCLPKLSSKNLKPLPIQFAELDDNAFEEMNKSIRTPRHQSYKIKDLQGIKTQKLSMVKKPTANREKLPSLTKNTDPHKENLFDLDLCFELDASKLCQNERLTERNNFVIRRVNTPSKSSKGKDTSAGSSDSSLEGTQQLRLALKNATDSPQIKLGEGRGKSFTKNIQACRIVNSKKLPFDLNPRAHKKRRSNLEEKDLDISIIEMKEEDRLISMDSYQELCAFF